MKKTLITLALTLAVVSTGLSQGIINWANANSSKISINTSQGGSLTGIMPANATQSYYFALFYSTSATVGGISTALLPTGGVNGTYVIQDSNWTFLSPSSIGGYVTGPAYATNSTAGRFTPIVSDSTKSAVVTANTTPEHWVVLGWSASDGTSIQDLTTWYNGGSPGTAGWIGESVVTGSLAPGDPTTSPPGTATTVFPGAFSLGVVYVPEPSTMVLAGLGGLSLLLFRRRK